MAETLVKARTIDVPESRRMPEDPFAKLYAKGVLAPPYDLYKLSIMPEHSSILPQCIDAYETNIDGVGYMFDPAPWTKPDENGEYPEEVQAELQALQEWFEYCHPEESFISIRRKTRRDLESTGNGYWELLRNAKGELVGIEHIEAYTMRLTSLDRDPVEIRIPIVRKGEIQEVLYRKRFRRFVQVRDGLEVWFKEFGDPRRIDARTGEVIEEGKAEPSGFIPATEVLHFRIYSPHTPYGVPRWIGTLPAVLGGRDAEEVNQALFDNNAIPPLVVIVEGGKLSRGSERVLKNFLQANKGKEMFHRILILEAEAPLAGEGAESKIKIQPLVEAQQKDALFLRYDTSSRAKVRSSFRLPPLYVGETEDYTRATAEASRLVAEQQVFGPLRDEFDFLINRRLLPALGVRYWRFKSLAPTVDEAESMADMLKIFVSAGMTVREARRYMEEILNKPLPDPEGADWLDEPLQVYLAKLAQGLGLVPEGEGGGGEKAAEEAAEKVARFLVKVRRRLESHALGIAG